MTHNKDKSTMLPQAKRCERKSYYLEGPEKDFEASV